MQWRAVDEDHVVVEAVQRRLHAFTLAPPPAHRLGREQRGPARAPHVATEALPFARHARALEHRYFVQIGLDGDALVELQIAAAVDAAAHHDGVTADDARHGRLDGGRLLDCCPRCLRLALWRHEVDVRRLGHGVALRHRAIRATRWLGHGDRAQHLGGHQQAKGCCPGTQRQQRRWMARGA